MKKLKKISALFATVSMTLLTTINAFAFDTLTFVGNPNLFGKQDNSANQKILAGYQLLKTKSWNCQTNCPVYMFIPQSMC